ncbi:CvpA family protein [Chitinilyticum piscinae]|uniref:CvpA family protein n=1 Tax=Chitinilyticum piscinae TaxID=2866724 RepID=A0A8J7KAY3_9NEIS|nr:CvpA family protein [Chitinilyticum piscinae]MBE9609619.1 CvpA family protein [Chitinilyticum piscinae]
MTLVDYVALTIIGLSILLSVMRGLVPELLALLAWVLAFWLACTYSDELSTQMPASLPSDGLRYLAAFVVIFFAVWVVSAIVRITLNAFLKASGLKVMDRVMGAGFGLLRGYLFVLMLVILAGLTSLPRSEVWRNAMFSPLFEESVLLLRPWLPAMLGEHLRYE